MPKIDGLIERIESYLDPSKVSLVERAFYVAKKAHEGQFRRSGDPYIIHPLAVANILADLHLDHETLMAALLHDVIEDTPTTKELKFFGRLSGQQRQGQISCTSNN